MLKSEVLELLKDINDDGNVEEILKGTDLYKSSTRLENVKGLFTSDSEFKKFLDSEKDKHSAKALETWKANNLEKLVQAELLKKNPQLTPEQKRIQELETKFAEMEKEKAKAVMTSKFKDVLNEKKIPSQMVNFLLAEDDEITNANISIFEEAMQAYVDSKVTERLGSSKHTPPKSDANGITKEQFNKMNILEKQKMFMEQPDLYKELSVK